MGDYICVDVGAEVESDAETARVGGGVRVGDLGETGRVGEADSYWCGGIVEVGCGGEFFGFWGGCEGAIEHQATSVCWSGSR